MGVLLIAVVNSFFFLSFNTTSVAAVRNRAAQAPVKKVLGFWVHIRSRRRVRERVRKCKLLSKRKGG